MIRLGVAGRAHVTVIPGGIQAQMGQRTLFDRLVQPDFGLPMKK
jgi:hypothetical protein